MSENSTDPLALLKELSSLLNTNGGVTGLGEMQLLTTFMKDATHLVSRCVYLNILRMTETSDLLDKFVVEGGWEIVNKWLVEAKDSENLAFILEVLKLLQRLPLKITHLKQNNTPKLVKSFAKSTSCSKVKGAASVLMRTWLGIIRDASGPSDSKKKPNSKSKTDSKGDFSAKMDSNAKPPTISKSPTLSSFRKTGLETSQEPKKSSKSDKVTATKRNSLDVDTSDLPLKKTKPEPPKPQKKIAISAGFMDALNSIPSMPKRPAKRKPVPKPKVALGATAREKMSPTHSTFVTGEAGDFTASSNDRKSPSPVPAEPAKPKLNKYGKPKKSVRWLPDERLESIRYFEKEKGERVNVTTPSFKDALRRERILERQKMGDFHHQGEGQWRKPRLIKLPAPLVEIGCNSIEKEIQQEREKSVLQEIFLSLEMVPETPAEPDPEPYELIPPKIIPIEDPNDPGPRTSRSPSPENESEMKLEDNPEILKDKLREIIQTATAKTSENTNSSKKEPSPTAAQEMTFPPVANNNNPNMVYPTRPPLIPTPPAGYYNDPNMPLGPPPPHAPGVMGEHFNHPPSWGPPEMRHYNRPPYADHRVGGQPPPPHFPPSYRGESSWRPREPWRGQGHHIPGPWNDGRRLYHR